MSDCSSADRSLNSKEGEGSHLKTGRWTAEEDEMLKKQVEVYGKFNWKMVCLGIPGRSATQCLHRWPKIQPGVIKGSFSAEEDDKIIKFVEKEGPRKWGRLEEIIVGRTAKQIRDRWLNNLCPDVKKHKFSEDEEKLLFKLYRTYGTSWTKIAQFMPGRTQNFIKNK